MSFDGHRSDSIHARHVHGHAHGRAHAVSFERQLLTLTAVLAELELHSAVVGFGQSDDQSIVVTSGGDDFMATGSEPRRDEGLPADQ